MSSNYCVQLKENILVLSMFIANPVNFTSLQFSLSVNSLVIFLFSKYPFNFGYGGYFCINQDEFGFAQVGESFDIDLSNYQNYYMLILIYPQGINLGSVGACNIISNFTMTFQNTTISSAENITVNSNYDGQEETGFCQGYDVQSMIPSGYCSNYSVYSTISLDNLNNYLVIMTCQGFLIQNNTTVEFITPHTCSNIGAYVTAEIVFSANSQVIDFLNSNNISYSIVSSSECKLLCKPIPCKSIYKIGKLLSSPTKYSLISSKLWNEIVQDLYLTYSVFKYINYLSQFSYTQNIYPAILEFYDFNKNFQPYPFTPLLYAQKGTPLTAEEFNKLIDAITKLANENTIQLQANLNKVHHDEVVRASQFSNIVYNVNQFLTFNYNQYFLLSCTGNEFSNLLNSISTFLTVLISEPSINITISTNVYIKNLLIYCNNQTITINGSIDKFILNSNRGTILLQNFASINSFILKSNFGTIEIEDNSNINTLQINQNPRTIKISGNSNITTLQVQNNTGTIEIEDYAVIENLICKENSGTVNISSTAVVLNNNCS